MEAVALLRIVRGVPWCFSFTGVTFKKIVSTLSVHFSVFTSEKQFFNFYFSSSFKKYPAPRCCMSGCGLEFWFVTDFCFISYLGVVVWLMFYIKLNAIKALT